MDSVADSCEQEAAMSVQEWSFMLFVVLSVCPLSLTAGNNFVNASIADRRPRDGCSVHACLLVNDMRCIEGASLSSAFSRAVDITVDRFTPASKRFVQHGLIFGRALTLACTLAAISVFMSD